MNNFLNTKEKKIEQQIVKTEQKCPQLSTEYEFVAPVLAIRSWLGAALHFRVIFFLRGSSWRRYMHSLIRYIFFSAVFEELSHQRVEREML